MKKWAIILGGSSGIGLATAKKLGQHGYNLIIAHRDRRSDLEQINGHFEEIRQSNVHVEALNFDATNQEKITEYLDQIKDLVGEDHIAILVHGISRGNLKPLVGNQRLSAQDLHLTIDAMALSLQHWVNQLMDANLLTEGSTIVTLSSAGNEKIWPGYAAVGMAKSTMETLSKYLAVELAEKGIRVLCVKAGITDTPSLKMIPGYDQLKKHATSRNPSGRMTEPGDVANAIYILTLPEAKWITGSIIHVDGGEHLIG